MIKNPSIPTITDPQLIDAALAEINTKLVAGLSWLNSAFGKAIRLEETVDGKKRAFPAIYTGETLGTEYIKLIPDSHLGNFSFFDVEDGDEAKWVGRNYDQFVSRIGLVFWFDFRDVYPSDHTTRTIDNVKATVYRLLKEMRLTKSTISFNKFHERKERVYRGYWVPDMDNQFYMRPYGLFRLDGEIRYRETSTPC